MMSGRLRRPSSCKDEMCFLKTTNFSPVLLISAVYYLHDKTTFNAYSFYFPTLIIFAYFLALSVLKCYIGFLGSKTVVDHRQTTSEYLS